MDLDIRYPISESICLFDYVFKAPSVFVYTNLTSVRLHPASTMLAPFFVTTMMVADKLTGQFPAYH